MFGKKGDEGRRFLDGSRVGCPLRETDVDIEVCLACPRLRRFVSDDRPYVTCVADRGDPRVAALLLS